MQQYFDHLFIFNRREISRKNSIFVVLPILLSTILFSAHEAQSQEQYDGTTLEVETWMDSWTSNFKSVDGGLHVMRFKDPTYVLTRPIKWTADHPAHSDLPSVTVPKGFVTDFTSIPQPFWSLLRPDGNYTFAAIVHDYLYWSQSTDRKTADLIFKLAMKDLSISEPVIKTIHWGVRLGGNKAWKDNARLKSKGEKRFLVEWPSDPTITWDEWKIKDGVFSKP